MSILLSFEHDDLRYELSLSNNVISSSPLDFRLRENTTLMAFWISVLYNVNIKGLVKDVKNRNKKNISFRYDGILTKSFLLYTNIILILTNGAAHMKNDKNIISCNTNAFLQFALCLNDLCRDCLTFFRMNKNVMIYWHNKITSGTKTKHNIITTVYIFKSIVLYNRYSSNGNAIAIVHANSRHIIAHFFVNVIWCFKGDTTASNRSQDSNTRCPTDDKRHNLDKIYAAVKTSLYFW